MILPIPKLGKKVRLSIPESHLEMAPSVMDDNLRDMAQMYLALGGDPSLSWPARINRFWLIGDLTSKISTLILDYINQDIARPFENGAIHLKIAHMVNGEGRWVPIVGFEADSYYPMGIDFLEPLAAIDEKKYKLARDVMRAFLSAPMVPVINHDFMASWMYGDEFEGDPKEDPDAYEYYKEIRRETRIFKKYMNLNKHGYPKGSFKRIVISVEKQYEDLKLALSVPERNWVESALALFHSTQYPMPDSFISSEACEDGSCETQTLENMAIVLWSCRSYFCDEVQQYHDETFGNNQVINLLTVKGMEDLVKIRNFNNMLFNLEVFAYQTASGEVWNNVEQG